MTKEQYEYTVVDHARIVDEMIGETLDVVLAKCNATLVHQFQGVAVIRSKTDGRFFGVRWRILMP